MSRRTKHRSTSYVSKSPNCYHVTGPAIPNNASITVKQLKLSRTVRKDETGFFLFTERCILILSHYRCNVSANQPCTMNQHVSWHSTALVTPFWKLSVLCTCCAAALVRSWRHHKERRRSFSPCSNAPRTGLRLRKVKNLLSYMRSLAMKCLPGSQSCVKEVEIYLSTVISHTNCKDPLQSFDQCSKISSKSCWFLTDKGTKVPELLSGSVMEAPHVTFSSQSISRVLSPSPVSVNIFYHNPARRLSVQANFLRNTASHAIDLQHLCYPNLNPVQFSLQQCPNYKLLNCCTGSGRS